MSVQPIGLPLRSLLGMQALAAIDATLLISYARWCGRRSNSNQSASIALSDSTSTCWPASYVKGQLTPIPPQYWCLLTVRRE